MVVKAERGRRRYIAFTLDDGITREMLIGRLRSLSGDSAPYVVQCSGGWCILRTDPEGCDAVISLMTRAYPDSRSVSTSGTLRRLRTDFPILQATRPPARR